MLLFSIIVKIDIKKSENNVIFAALFKNPYSQVY